MSFQKFIIIITAFILLTFAGCGNTSNTTVNSTTNAANVNAATPLMQTRQSPKNPNQRHAQQRADARAGRVGILRRAEEKRRCGSQKNDVAGFY